MLTMLQIRALASAAYVTLGYCHSVSKKLLKTTTIKLVPGGRSEYLTEIVKNNFNRLYFFTYT